MKILRKAMVVATTIGLAFYSTVQPIAASANDAPALSAYGELPEIEDAALSPSGKRLAALLSVRGTRVLVAFDENNAIISRTNVDAYKVRRFDWVGEDRLLLTYSTTEDLGANFTTDKHEFSFAVTIPINVAEQGNVVFSNRRTLVNSIFGNYGIRQIGGRWYGFFGAIELARGIRAGEYEFRHGRPYLYRVDMVDNSTERVATAASDNHDNDWLIDANGDVAATYDIHRENGRWDIRNGNRQIIAEGQSVSGRSGLIGLGYGGQSVIYYNVDENNRSRRFEVPLSGGEPEEFLPGIDIDRLYFDAQTGHLSGYLEEGADPRPVFEDPDKAQAVRMVREAFADFSMSMMDWSDDLSHVVVRTSGQFDSGTWFTVDVGNLSAEAIAYERPDIEPQHVGPFSTFDYTASDGLEMDGVLTLPPGREANNLPVIMLPHGGPHSFDSERFDWWAQAFASRGYAVFQPNFRGSTNRDGAFRRAGYGEWGRKMQTDISDGLAALAEAGIVDPDRACIVGASYGGYAALAGVTLQQGLYRCSVAVAPVSDIRRMYREDYRASGETRITRTALREQLGDPDTWDAVSPERFAERADAPILLIHGRDDTVVPYIHSVKMADALDDEDKPHELITLDGEDHWLSLSETRQIMLNSAVAFVQEHNPAD
ncbi:alpha/beta hydrolase family protein [Erythrobacter sp. Alg231-14]|uniref:alpha/beta hydrolase family protein n=1 Tax=Erythrobacter sp. Alg231-14 TaxID=1922225 RepID=UPI00307B636C